MSEHILGVESGADDELFINIANMYSEVRSIGKEIVRCRDCKFGVDGGKYCAEGCADSWDWRNVEPDGFCAWSERK